MAGRPLRPATDHRLGRPLPHQLANRTQAPPSASPKTLSSPELPSSERMRNYPAFPRATPHQWAGSPRVPHPSATFRSEERTFDLHALGTPPALILSQDQTLHQNCHPSRSCERTFTSHCACVVHDAPPPPVPKRNQARPARRSSIFGRPLGTPTRPSPHPHPPKEDGPQDPVPASHPATNLSMCDVSATGGDATLI